MRIRFLLSIIFGLSAFYSSAQTVESIHFNLYTDSLKKGTHNYINVDGKMSNGTWLPLTSKEIQFSSSACRFSGNELVVPPDFNGDSITIKAILKAKPGLTLERTIWIKKAPDPELPTKEEVLRGYKQKRKRN